LHAISNRGLLLAALLLSLIGISTFATPADAARSFTTGIVDGDSYHLDDDTPFNRTSSSGAKLIKNNLYWVYMVSNGDSADRPGSELQPFVATDPASPYYNWSGYDRMVRKADAHGLEMVFTIVSAPRWARIASCANSGVCATKPADLAEFATAAATRYSGSFDPGDGNGVLPRVRFWQAGSEPNFHLFFKPFLKPNGAPAAPYEYRKSLTPFYDAIHAVDDSNVVIAAGLAPNGKRGQSIAPLDFTRRALCMTGNFKKPRPIKGCNFKVKADAWAIHPYTTGGPTHLPNKGDDMSVAALPRLQKLLAAATRAGRLSSNSGHTELWVTEFSWDSKPPDPGGVPWNLQTRWVAQAMYLMYKAKVQKMFWFGLRDQPKGDGKWSWSFQSGLYLRGKTIEKDKPKKVLKAFRYPFYAQRVGKKGFSFWGRTPNSKKATVDLFARRRARGRFARVGTVKANANGIFTGMMRRRGFTTRGSVYAKVRGGRASVAFGLWKTKDIYQPPFG
jgi:hypothetical protein